MRRSTTNPFGVNTQLDQPCTGWAKASISSTWTKARLLLTLNVGVSGQPGNYSTCALHHSKSCNKGRGGTNSIPISTTVDLARTGGYMSTTPSMQCKHVDVLDDHLQMKAPRAITTAFAVCLAFTASATLAAVQ